MLRRLSAFSGGWTVVAAERVCASDGIDAANVLDLLTALVDKNLVVVAERSGATRYGLLETVRHYAHDRLRKAGEEAQTHARHLEYFVAVAEEAEERLKGSKQQAWLERLDLEIDNMRAAMTRTGDTGGDAVLGLRLSAALFVFWIMRGHISEGRSRIRGLLIQVPGDSAAAKAVRVKALYSAGDLARLQHDEAAMHAYLEECLRLCAELGNRSGFALATIVLSYTQYRRGNYAAAGIALNQCLDIFRDLGEEPNVAMALIRLGRVAAAQGDFASARSHIEESLALLATQGDPRMLGFALTCMSNVLRSQGEYAKAEALCAQALDTQHRIGDHYNVAGTLNVMGRLARLQNRATEAEAWHRESLMRWRALGNLGADMADAFEGLAAVAAVTMPERAARLWGKAQSMREETCAPIHTSERPEHERMVAAARAAFSDDAAFDVLWQEGRRMTLDEACLLALGTTGAFNSERLVESTPPNHTSRSDEDAVGAARPWRPRGLGRRGL